nr:polysaccharide deacetylase family protein [bacterium]
MYMVVVDKKRIISIAVIAAVVLAGIIGLIAALTGGSSSQTLAPQATGRLLPVYRVEEPNKRIALTFDAAWGQEYVQQILDTLDQYKVKCTFFMVGYWVDNYPDLARMIVSRGHEIGNHSTNHLHMRELTREQMEADIAGMNEKMIQVTGKKPALFRCPFGEYNDLLLRVAQEQGLVAVQWSVDGKDWDGKKAEEITKRVTQAQPGDIVLLHLNSQEVAKALPDILDRLSADG